MKILAKPKLAPRPSSNFTDVHVFFDPQTHEKLLKLSVSTDRKLSNLVRHIVHQWLEEHS